MPRTNGTGYRGTSGTVRVFTPRSGFHRVSQAEYGALEEAGYLDFRGDKPTLRDITPEDLQAERDDLEITLARYAGDPNDITEQQLLDWGFRFSLRKNFNDDPLRARDFSGNGVGYSVMTPPDQKTHKANFYAWLRENPQATPKQAKEAGFAGVLEAGKRGETPEKKIWLAKSYAGVPSGNR